MESGPLASILDICALFSETWTTNLLSNLELSLLPAIKHATCEVTNPLLDNIGRHKPRSQDRYSGRSFSIISLHLTDSSCLEYADLVFYGICRIMHSLHDPYIFVSWHLIILWKLSFFSSLVTQPLFIPMSMCICHMIKGGSLTQTE